MEPDPRDDAELLAAHAAGDAHAFTRLYDRYDTRAFQFIRRTLGAAHAEAAEDLHQETWIAVSRNASAFDPARAGFAAWLFTIARRKVWDHFRRRRVAVVGAGSAPAAETLADPGPTPLQQVETREMAERLVAAVEALPLAQRESLVLSANAGLSLLEIAEITGAGVETTKSRLRYARAALRRALSGEDLPHA